MDGKDDFCASLDVQLGEAHYFINWWELNHHVLGDRIKLLQYIFGGDFLQRIPWKGKKFIYVHFEFIMYIVGLCELLQIWVMHIHEWIKCNDFSDDNVLFFEFFWGSNLIVSIFNFTSSNLSIHEWCFYGIGFSINCNHNDLYFNICLCEWFKLEGTFFIIIFW